ncbi:radical SAM protein [Clostridium taeniosporum]|uniref:Radical SAM protein n=1 Tax=Clostridium taeniosporum TaxID=394958 RepID=A0A1D7XJC1_9CLOT|nr:radical SAM protein [Clostridium taeniosporum]AOR23425.1 radical SAM protein [Clostridium taeniosporum]
MYDYPLYRPPSEGNSLIIQATLGCSHNKCSFCSMYKSKSFVIKSLEQIKKEIDYFRQVYSYVEKIFLADGDALIIPMNDLKEILLYIKEVFPECIRVTLYGTPKSIMIKSIEELQELKKLGLYMIYMGIESGDDVVLLDINKGVNSKELVKAAQKVKESKILLSVTVISGIGGKEYSKNHAINTGKIISEIEPDYLGVLTLMLEKETHLYNKILNNEFKILEDIEVLDEIKLFLENIRVHKPAVFRCNHASNYISLKGTLPLDKERLLNEIIYYKSTSDLKKEEYRQL